MAKRIADGVDPSPDGFSESAKRWLGQIVDGRYRILEVLGEGGMGAVFVAQHLTLHKEVALKMVRPEYAGNRDLAARFAREAMVTSRIDHPNVISAIDFGTLDDGIAYLTMELVRGRSLAELVEEADRFPWGRAADVGAQIADALAAAGVHGIVHRDLKPENVLLQPRSDGGDQVRVLDFGIAKFSRDSLAPPALRGAQQVTEVGVVIGTPGYMAPEQAVGRRADSRADAYSLGVLLWEMIVGRRLWEGDTTQEIIRSQLRDNPHSVREVTGDGTIPVELDRLILQLLANAPHDRPGDIGAVRDALNEAALAARGRGSIKALAAAASAAADVTRGLPPPQRLPREFRNGHPTQAMRPTPTLPRAPTPLAGESAAPQQRARRRLPGSLLVAAGLLAAAVGLVATGQLEIRPKGDLHRLAAELDVGPRGEPRVVKPAAEATDPTADEATDEAADEAVQQAVQADEMGEATEAALVEESLGPEATATAPTPAEDSAGGTGLPPRLEPALEALVQGRTRTRRVEAAHVLLGHIPVNDVPAYARSLAHLQLAESCAQKRRALGGVAAARDPRALPALVLTSERGKEGCGKRDCLACMRRELDALVRRLEAASR